MTKGNNETWNYYLMIVKKPTEMRIAMYTHSQITHIVIHELTHSHSVGVFVPAHYSVNLLPANI
jgi:hypothetical protein